MMYNIFKIRGRGNLTGMRFESSIEIKAPVKKVWALVDKLEEWPQWAPSIKKLERISKGPLMVGSRVFVTARVSRLTVKSLMTVTKFIPERAVVLEGKVLGAKLTRFYTLEPANGNTKVAVGGEVSGVLAWLLRRGGQAISNEIAQAAKKKVEGSE